MDTLQLGQFWNAFPSLDRDDALLASELTRRQVVRWPSGTVLVRDGDECSAAPLVLAGLLEVSKTTDSARRIRLYTLGPGECCPLTATSLMGGDSFPAQVSVDGDTQAVMVPSELFVALVGRSPSFRRLAFGQLAQRLGSVIELVEALAFRHLDQRVAALLVASADDTVRKTHQELADAVGSSREVVTRILRDFERQGWIESSRGSLKLLERETLRQL